MDVQEILPRKAVPKPHEAIAVLPVFSPSYAVARRPGNILMAERERYRAYVLRRDHGVQIAHDLYCKDLDAAIERAKLLTRNGNEIELWHAHRRVIRISPDQ